MDLGELVALIESARRAAARSVNAVMTATYFVVGRAIVEHEQKGAKGAAYGEQLLELLSLDVPVAFHEGESVEERLAAMTRLCRAAWLATGRPLPPSGRAERSSRNARV